MNKNTPNGIKNPQTPVPKTPQMNDRDFLNDALTTEKYITSSYSIALKEEAMNRCIVQLRLFPKKRKTVSGIYII